MAPASSTHLAISRRALMTLLSVLAAIGLTLGVVGLHAGYDRLPEQGDTVLSVAIAIATGATACTLYVALVLIPRRYGLHTTIARPAPADESKNGHR